jgi:hypothetical protein
MTGKAGDNAGHVKQIEHGNEKPLKSFCKGNLIAAVW